MFTMSKADSAKLENIKRRALAGASVSAQEKQWVLDFFKKSQLKAPAEAIKMAKTQGFDVAGVCV